MSLVPSQMRRKATGALLCCVFIQAKPIAQAKGRWQHDLQIGKQPDYVDRDRTRPNRVLFKSRPWPQI